MLQLKGIHKSFEAPGGPIKVLDNISLTLEAGQSISIGGESGTGKTTLLYIIAGLERPKKGDVIWRSGFSITKKSPSVVAKQRGLFMGFIFQSYHLFPELTALENVLFPCRLLNTFNTACKKRAYGLLERLSLTHRLNALPSYLSGGERQRLAIARALIHQPALILADEPTGNLDEATGSDVLALLLKLCSEESTTLILVTHNHAFSQKTQRSVYLKHGTLIQDKL